MIDGQPKHNLFPPVFSRVCAPKTNAGRLWYNQRTSRARRLSSHPRAEATDRESRRAGMFPILYQNGPFVLYTHDVMTVLGLLAGLALYY